MVGGTALGLFTENPNQTLDGMKETDRWSHIQTRHYKKEIRWNLCHTAMNKHSCVIM